MGPGLAGMHRAMNSSRNHIEKAAGRGVKKWAAAISSSAVFRPARSLAIVFPLPSTGNFHPAQFLHNQTPVFYCAFLGTQAKCRQCMCEMS